jgi:hypothetical protein
MRCEGCRCSGKGPAGCCCGGRSTGLLCSRLRAHAFSHGCGFVLLCSRQPRRPRWPALVMPPRPTGVAAVVLCGHDGGRKPSWRFLPLSHVRRPKTHDRLGSREQGYISAQTGASRALGGVSRGGMPTSRMTACLASRNDNSFSCLLAQSFMCQMSEASHTCLVTQNSGTVQFRLPLACRMPTGNWDAEAPRT